MHCAATSRQTGTVPYGPEMRASDSDREKIVARLRDAHIEGRLSAEEFEDRLNVAYSAQTYGELEPLVRDLPVVRQPKPQPPVSPQPMVPPPPPPSRSTGDQVMRVLWTIWACVASVNLVIWVLVSLTNWTFEYFWPAWVAGPPAAILLSIEAGRRASRK